MPSSGDRTDFRDSIPYLHFGISNIDVRLEVQEIVFAHAEIAAQANGRIGSDLPSIVEDVLDTGNGDIDVVGEAIRRNTQRNHVLFLEDLADLWRFDLWRAHTLSIPVPRVYEKGFVAESRIRAFLFIEAISQ